MENEFTTSTAAGNSKPIKDEVPLHLAPGKNHLFLKIGNVDGRWEFAVRIPGYENGVYVKAKEVSPEQKQRAYALARKPDGNWLNPGNPRRGEKIFHDKDGPLAAICATCHAIGALGGQTGPNLSLIGSIYNRADLITSVLEPSKTIALGFDNAIVETKNGETIAGVLRNESAEAIGMIGADGQLRTLAKAEVKTLTRLPVSFMPPGLTLGLKPEQFTDLVAYLESLGRP
jgi:putative heme-binding domain-containing protein